MWIKPLISFDAINYDNNFIQERIPEIRRNVRKALKSKTRYEIAIASHIDINDQRGKFRYNVYS